MVKLLIQPQDGIAALLSAIGKARTSIDIVISASTGPRSRRR
jgi:hypothetical protein